LSHQSIFNSLAEEIFLQLMELHPEVASYMGLHHYDYKLPDGSVEAIEREKGLIKLSLEKLKRVDPRKLDIDSKMDYYSLIDYLRLRLFFLEDWPRWKMYPEALDTIMYALIPLFIKEYGPVIDRFENIIYRLEAVPKFLEQSKSRLQMPIRIFLNLALESANRLQNFIKSIYKILEEEVGKLVREKRDVFDRAIEAIEKYKDWIDAQRSREIRIFHMGEDVLRKYFDIRGIDWEPTQLLEFAEKDMEYARKELRALASELDSSLNPVDVIEDISSKKPANFAVVLAAYEKAIQEAKRVVIEKNIASIPRESLEVRDTPVAIRDVVEPILYVPPGKYEVNKVGKLLITPVETEEEFKVHNAYSIAHIAIREGFPGKHLLCVWTTENKSLVRQLVDAPETVEGWACYVDEAMGEVGYLTTIRDKFLRVHNFLVNAALAVIDVKISLGDMSIHEAVKFLTKETFINEKKALSEVLVCAHSPGYQLSKYYGLKKLKSLRGKVETILGKYYSLKWFHDAILQTGILPMKYLELTLLYKAVQHLINCKVAK